MMTLVTLRIMAAWITRLEIFLVFELKFPQTRILAEFNRLLQDIGLEVMQKRLT